MLKKILFIILTLFLLISAGRIVYAETIEKQVNGTNFSSSVYVGPDEVINNNFVRIGETIDINGTINGDVIVAGAMVNINATVQGDILAAGNTVKIRGNIAGNVRVAGANVDIDATIGKNTNAFGNTVTINDKTSIGWSLVFGAAAVEINGQIGGHVDGGANQTIIKAKVGGEVNIYNGEEGVVSISSPAEIKGNFTYIGEKAPTIQEGTEIQGDVIHKTRIFPDVSENKLEKIFGLSALFIKIIKLFGLLVVGLVIITIFKKETPKIVEQMKNEPLKSIGWGLVYLILTPIMIFILLFTVIGIPLALILLGLYLISLYISKVFFGLMIGFWLLYYFKKDKKDPAVPLMTALILGTIIFVLVTFIHYLGLLVSLAGTVWGLGALVEVKKQIMKENK